MARPRATPNFVVTGVTETRDGFLLRVQRLEGGSKPVLTAEVRVLHLDQVAIQISRGGMFYVMEPRSPGPMAKVYRLEIRSGRAGGWTVRSEDVPGAAEAVAALPSFPVLGVVRAPFARDAVKRAWPPDKLADSVL